MAQFWASTCRYMENEDRHSQSGHFDYVGENFAASISYTVNYTQIISQQWYGEKKTIQQPVMTRMEMMEVVKQVGRYTQVYP